MPAHSVAATYGAAPQFIGEFDLPWDEYLHFMYLPVQMPGHDGIRLPRRLAFLQQLVEQIVDNEQHDGYVYVTARRGYATPGNPLNRPGWHADGFGTADINYVWTDRFPTLYAEHPFDNITDDHQESMRQFEIQAGCHAAGLRTYPNRTLLRLDPFVVHAAPAIPSPGGERSFLKISLSHSRYNLRGNSHNYRFDYVWQMWSRAAIRNDPAYAGGDAGPQVAA